MSVDIPLVARAFAATGLIFALLYALQVALRRSGRFRPAGGGRLLRIAESLFLPEGASLHLIEADGRRYLIGRAAGGVNLLCEVPAQTAARSG